MCPETETLKYIEKSETLKIYTEPKNICYLNDTSIKVNEECCKRFSQGMETIKVNFRYNNKRGANDVCKGVPVIATTNLKNHEIFNTMEFIVEDICERIKIDGEELEIKEFAKSFIPFCVTVYKYQGASIGGHYNIYDVNRMDKRQLHTSVSRTTKLRYIHLETKKINKKYFSRGSPTLDICNAKQSAFFSGYKVTFNDGQVYIGCTCEDLNKTRKWHLTQKRSHVYANRDKDPQPWSR